MNIFLVTILALLTSSLSSNNRKL